MAKTKKKRKFSTGNFIYDAVIYIILAALVVVTFYPMWYVFVASFSTSTDIASQPGLLLWPKEFVTGAYEMVFDHPLVLSGFKNTFTILLISLPINIVMTMFCGYFMSCSNMMFKKPIVGMIMFTMFFNGGLIPNFLNIKSLGLYNTLWAVILPWALNVYNAIICKTAIEAIPESLKESAYIDGANDIQVIFKVILPLMKPTLAVLLLYYGVSHWNAWFSASIYIKDNKLLPVQNVIRSILVQNSQLGSSGVAAAADQFSAYAETIKYAAIVVTTVPILCVYPFLQKYFTKGAMIGAVKG